jgi:hypothetical protein
MVPREATAANAGVQFTFDQGLTPNTDYSVAFIARDTAGNCQPAYTQVAIHTADNIPPTTVTLAVANITGTTAELQLQLDEPGTAFFAVLPANASSGACPPAADVFAAGAAPGRLQAATMAAAAAGTFGVPSRSPATAVGPVVGLQSETAYAACVVAQDATQQRNNQSATRRVAFTTLDVTPPRLGIALSPGPDGDVACAREPPYLCALTWTATLSEPGAARWVLLRNDSGAGQAVLPRPAALLAQPLTSLFGGPLATAVVAEGNLSFPPSQSVPIAVAGLPSEAAYLLVAAGRDAAAPVPNVAPALVVVRVVAPDVTPPSLVSYGLAAAADARLDFALSLDESGTVAYVLVASPSSAPSAAQVFAETDAEGASPTASGNVSCIAANASAAFFAAGLEPGRLFDLHMAAVDAAGNVQANVSTLRRGAGSGGVAAFLCERMPHRPQHRAPTKSPHKHRISTCRWPTALGA